MWETEVGAQGHFSAAVLPEELGPAGPSGPPAHVHQGGGRPAWELPLRWQHQDQREMMVWAVRGDATSSPREGDRVWLPGLQGCEASSLTRSPAPLLKGHSLLCRMPVGKQAKWVFKALLSFSASGPQSQQS